MEVRDGVNRLSRARSASDATCRLHLGVVISGGHRVSYEEKKAAGDRGEAIVARILERRKAPDAIVLNDLLFDGVDTTTQLDHILIDRFGLLLVETKFYNAHIKGTSADSRWTACYKDGNRRELHNPLRQNESHRAKLLRVLQQNDFRLPGSYTQSVIVFAHGVVSDLELTPEDRARVMTPEDLERHLSSRADFAPNAGELDGTVASSIADLIRSLDKSEDPILQARHVAMVREASSRKSGRTRRGRAYRPTVPRRPAYPPQCASSQDAKGNGALMAILKVAGILLLLWMLANCATFSGAAAHAPSP
ncbi:MAG: NERD domain-containing protein [Actinobacteria bacterium]|nr:MAG: NERD domain-containing protein [Actinomycetota bacterium]